MCEIHSRGEEHPRLFPQSGHFLPRVFSAIYKVCSHPHVNLFATRANMKLPLYIFPVLDLIAWKYDAFQHPWNNLGAKTFPPFTFSRQYLLSNAFNKSLLGYGSSSLASEVVSKSIGFSVGRTFWAPFAVEPFSPAAHQKVSQRSWNAVSACMEVSKRLVCKAGFSNKVVEVIFSDLRRSTACLYLGNWSRFLHCRCGRNIFLQDHCSTDCGVLLYLWRESCLSLLWRGAEPPQSCFFLAWYKLGNH